MGILELLFALLEGAELLLGLIDLLLGLLDLGLWIKSRNNRRNRREAKRYYERIPPRNGWSWAFIITTAVVMILTGLLIAKFIMERI
jgi:hypothetical protein